MAFCHKISKYTITNAIYFDWQSTIVWLKSVFKHYFDDWLVSFKQQDGNFFWNRKKFTSQQTLKGPYIYDIHRKGSGGKVFVGAVNIWPLNGLKLQPIQLLEELFFPSISSQIHSDCIDNNLHCIGNNHSTVDQIKLPVTCSLSLIFYVKKYYGLLNIASWLTSSKTLWRRKCNSSS